jgi:hypothetical protein
VSIRATLAELETLENLPIMLIKQGLQSLRGLPDPFLLFNLKLNLIMYQLEPFKILTKVGSLQGLQNYNYNSLIYKHFNHLKVHLYKRSGNCYSYEFQNSYYADAMFSIFIFMCNIFMCNTSLRKQRTV